VCFDFVVAAMFSSAQFLAGQPTQAMTTALLPPQYSAQPPQHYVLEQPAQQPQQFVSQQPVYYVFEKPATYTVQHPVQQHVVGQSVQYMTQEMPQAVHYQVVDSAQPEYMVMPDGRVVEMVQRYPAVDGQALQPSGYGTAAQHAPQTEVYNISPEQFAFVMRGGSIPETHLRMMPRATAPALPHPLLPGTASPSPVSTQSPGPEWAKLVSQPETTTPTMGAPFAYW